MRIILKLKEIRIMRIIIGKRMRIIRTNENKKLLVSDKKYYSNSWIKLFQLF